MKGALSGVLTIAPSAMTFSFEAYLIEVNHEQTPTVEEIQDAVERVLIEK